MTNKSDRAYFLAAVRNRSFTVPEIITTFGVSQGTARLWVKHEALEKIEGSWPIEYALKDSVFPEALVSEEVPHGVVRYDIPAPTLEEKETFFRAIMAADNGSLDFIVEFRKADSQKDLKILIHKLKSSLIVTDYYLELMKEEGTP